MDWVNPFKRHRYNAHNREETVMTIETKQRIYELVKVVCGTTTMTPEEEALKEQGHDMVPDVPTNKTFDAAHEILNLAGVTPAAYIFEIPLCWDDQVAIRFTIGEESPQSSPMFCLLAGVHCNDPSKFFFDIQMEDFLGNIPVDSDDDGGFYLLSDMWEIKSGKIVA